MHIELIHLVDALIDAELEVRYVDFFRLASAIVHLIVFLYHTSLRRPTSKPTLLRSSPRK